jgi:CheY-like chemotaxis protein
MHMTTQPIEILLVEDNPGDVRLTKEAMRESTIPNRLNVVEDGVQAMEFLRREGKYKDSPRPDIILLDLNLPRKDGREVLNEIKSDANLKRIPVIVFTTSSDERDILNSYNLYANCFISKPIDMGNFMAMARKIEHFWFSIATLPPS